MLPLFRITANLRQFAIGHARYDDFAIEPAGEISEEDLLNDPSISLYCFNPDEDEAIFVKCRTPEQLETAAFYYQKQAELAEWLIKVPMEAFHRLAQGLKAQCSTLNALILVHSVGRCGSTLISKVLGALPQVNSISEPDDLTQLVVLREADGSNDEWIKAAIASGVRWRFKKSTKPKTIFTAIKTRSEALVNANLFAELFPTAKHIFISREPMSWMKSIAAGWSTEHPLFDPEENEKIEEGWGRMIPLISTTRVAGKARNVAQLRMLCWITCMQGSRVLESAGIPLHKITFEDITADPRKVVEDLLGFLEITEVDWSAIEEVLGKDSQEGTMYDRKLRKGVEFTEELRRRAQEMLEKYG